MLSIAHYTKNFANNQSGIGSLKIFPRAEIEQCINPRLDHLGRNLNVCADVVRVSCLVGQARFSLLCRGGRYSAIRSRPASRARLPVYLPTSAAHTPSMRQIMQHPNHNFP